MRARKTRLIWAAGVAALAATAVVATAIATNGGSSIRGNLSGYQEIMSATQGAVSTSASGSFKAKVVDGGQAIDYTLKYSALEGDVQQAHIHFGQLRTNGAISAFLCSNLGNGPAGTQACPPGPATVTGTIDSADVIGPAAQGIEAGALGGLVRAIRAGVTYANVHSTKWPSGEVRGQLKRNKDR